MPLSVPSAPNKPGQDLTASVTVQSNGNQRFVVPVTLRIEGGGAFNFDESAPVLAPEPEIVEEVEVVEPAAAVAFAPAPSPAATAPARPIPPPQIQFEPPPPAPRPYSRYRRPSKPLWVHLLPAGLLGLALLVVVIADLIGRAAPRTAPTRTARGTVPSRMTPGAVRATGGTGNTRTCATPGRSWASTSTIIHRFGLEMLDVPDPRPEFKGSYKKITYSDAGVPPQGDTNNTIVFIGGSEYFFGEAHLDRDVKSENLPKGRKGNRTKMDFGDEKVRVTQHVEIVPGQNGLLDTCLIWYRIENYGESPIKVGVRFMLDTFIGANDGVPFTAPGVKGLIKDMREFKGEEVPPYLEVVENGDDAKNPGTVVRLGLKNIRLPGVANVEEPDDVRITHFPPSQGRQGWEVPMRSMKDETVDPKDQTKTQGDSCVAMYWPYDITKNRVAELPAGGKRDMAVTYGLSQLDISTGAGKAALALSTPDAVPPDTDFVVTAYVYNANSGDPVELTLPSGLRLASGETAKKTVEEGGKRSVVFWKVHAGSAGDYTIEAKSGGATAKHAVAVKKSSIFG